jgi:hypothetical protein
LDEDPFIESMLANARQLGEHMDRRGKQVEIRLANNAAIRFPAEVSAQPFFAAAVVKLTDVHGKVHFLDHVVQLREAQRRVKAALRRAATGADDVQ